MRRRTDVQAVDGDVVCLRRRLDLGRRYAPRGGAAEGINEVGWGGTPQFSGSVDIRVGGLEPRWRAVVAVPGWVLLRLGVGAGCRLLGVGGAAMTGG